MRKLLLLLFAAAIGISAYPQDFSNKGKDFWIGYGNHVRMYNPNSSQQEKMSLYLTSDVNTSGSIQIPSINFNQSFSISANQITVVDIPKTARLNADGLFNLGIHVTALQPIVVYAHIYAQNVSGATVCLPTSTLGKDYYSVNFTQQSNESPSYSWFLAIATEDNTTIEITPAATTLGGWAAGSVHAINLNKGQVYQVLADHDLTGSRIRSVAATGNCKRIAVYCGSGKVYIKQPDCRTNSADNLFQQMYPTATWGKHFITASSSNNQVKDQTNIYRIVKSDPDANVYLDGGLISAGSFTNNFFYEFNGTGTHEVFSDKPILVVQYFATENCYNNGNPGDPEMIYLNPVEQTISNVTLYSSQYYLIKEHFINIIIKNSGTALSSIKIDGSSVSGYFLPVAQNPDYAYARIPVQTGTHTIVSDSGFNAIAYGFGNAESYGYSAGTNLKDLYQFVSIENEYATVSFPAGCRNSPLKYYMTFPYKPTQIRWSFGSDLNLMGIRDTIINSPVSDSSWTLNGRTLYQYRLNRVFTISKSGTYPIKVFAINPTSDGCTGEQEIDYDLQVFDPPSASFSFNSNGCLADSVAFIDKTDGQGRPVARWVWSFDDGEHSASKNPKHKYQAAGNYTVSFAAITDVGCVSEPDRKVITITNPPLADFSRDAINCEKSPIHFTDQSNATGSVMMKWFWDLGDGTTIINPNAVPISHTYDKAGEYVVSLQVQNTAGCKSAVKSETVNIHYLPVPAFGLPAICLADPFAQFTDSSSIADKSEAAFRYSWSFGDGDAADNTSTLKNPQHRYTSVGNYLVHLTVTSGNGCSKDTSRMFTVNGEQPKATFEINKEINLCSNQEVRLTDRSTVDFGDLVKIEIYWDYLRDPAVKSVDEHPGKDRTYSFKYPDFGTPRSKTYQIRYVVYSGLSCVSEIDKTITVHASPQLIFDPLEPVCQEAESFLLKSVHETSGLPGLGVFTGQGVSGSGLFSPASALPGDHRIRYTYTADDGCSAYAEQNILVYSTPTVDAGPDRTVLEGGSITIDARASGHQLSYLWTPFIGMDRNNIPNPRISPVQDITYTLTVSSAEGCSAHDEVFVKVLKQIKVPNAFSPNNDGINDKWEIQYLETYPGCSIDVYNRYGQLVFHSVGYNKPWDGTFKEAPVPVGTYYWVINPKNGRAAVSGSVTVIR